MEEESIWSGLGSSVVGNIPTMKSDIEELKLVILNVQRELMGTLEANQRRLILLEEQTKMLGVLVRELLDRGVTVEATEKVDPDTFTSNALMYMSKEELGMAEQGEWGDSDEIVEPVKVVKSGLVAPPPESEEEGFEEIDFDDATERGGPDSWAEGIVAHIKTKGGVVNQYLMRLNLIPGDITKEERAEFKLVLETLGVSTYKVNQIRHFYYIGDTDGTNEYKKVYGN